MTNLSFQYTQTVVSISKYYICDEKKEQIHREHDCALLHVVVTILQKGQPFNTSYGQGATC